MKNGKMVPNCVPESVEENQWSSVEQKMVNQILRMKKGEMKVYELPSKTQKFYFKNKKKFESINEASMTVSIANIVQELFPKEFFWAYTPKDKERVKAVIGDLVRTLNTFYKKQNIKVRFTDSNIKMKMYAKENKSLNEIGIFNIHSYTKGILPAGYMDTTTPQKKEKYRSIVRDLVQTLNSFWKRNNIPFRVRKW